MSVTEWISSSIGTAFLLGLLAYLAKNWFIERLKHSIKHEYERELETHKAELRRDYDVQVERLRAQLQIEAAERSFRFSHVFERTAKVIETTYQKVLYLQQGVREYTALEADSCEDARRTHLEVMQARAKEFMDYWRPNKIYVPRSTAGLVTELFGTLDMFARKRTRQVMFEKGHPDRHEISKQLYNEVENLSGQVSELLTSLENDFQKILGFPIEEKPSEQ